MNPAKVVVHEVNRGGVLVVVQLLAKGVGQTGEAPITHAERKVLAFYVTGGDQASIRSASDANPARSGANGRRVTGLSFAGFVPIEFDQLRVINLGTKRAFHGLNVGFKAVRGYNTELAQWRVPFCSCSFTEFIRNQGVC